MGGRGKGGPKLAQVRGGGLGAWVRGCVGVGKGVLVAAARAGPSWPRSRVWVGGCGAWVRGCKYGCVVARDKGGPKLAQVDVCGCACVGAWV